MACGPHMGSPASITTAFTPLNVELSDHPWVPFTVESGSCSAAPDIADQVGSRTITSYSDR